MRTATSHSLLERPWQGGSETQPILRNSTRVRFAAPEHPIEEGHRGQGQPEDDRDEERGAFRERHGPDGSERLDEEIMDEDPAEGSPDEAHGEQGGKRVRARG